MGCGAPAGDAKDFDPTEKRRRRTLANDMAGPARPGTHGSNAGVAFTILG